MCDNDNSSLGKESLAVGLSVGNSMSGLLPGLEQYRLQLYHYAMAERIRLAQHLHPHHLQHNHMGQTMGVAAGQSNQGSQLNQLGSSFQAPLPLYSSGANYSRNLALSMAFLHPHQQQIPEEPKPQHSYIGLIAMAILSSPEKKLVLSDIYQHILEHYPYFRRRGPGWRNSIRHNLSLNDCFVKSGRSANGKGHYWAIHPANLEDFRRGDFRRRKAQRKVRRHMGLAVDEEPDSPSPPPLSTSPPPTSTTLGSTLSGGGSGNGSGNNNPVAGIWSSQHFQQHAHQHQYHIVTPTYRHASIQPSKKRQFDVASLLAPDDEIVLEQRKSRKLSCSEDERDERDERDEEVEVDVVAESERPVSTPEINPIGDYCSWQNSMNTVVENYFSTANHANLRNYQLTTNSITNMKI